ncbi:translation initiation factor IF-2 subunit beta [Candidatus Woesearchaeota archaeon]|jgi:translation initiation factor 2 subunit 2|nr:translation initiation factor IF-2 subunit beta [Candidatus Woesearchaeota archaeon]
MNYEDMLGKAREVLPEKVNTTSRFEVPKVKGRIEGNKTVISNFFQIADTIGRKPQHLLKYVLKELATPGNLKNQTVVFGSKIPATKINEKISSYVDEFVFCKECNGPDTKMVKEGDIYYIKCQACGARHSFYSKI